MAVVTYNDPPNGTTLQAHSGDTVELNLTGTSWTITPTTAVAVQSTTVSGGITTYMLIPLAVRTTKISNSPKIQSL
jgi:hypothetical protein